MLSDASRKAKRLLIAEDPLCRKRLEKLEDQGIKEKVAVRQLSAATV
jgi:hypothetical protein